MSGHIGGANEAAKKAAKIIGATTVITTSTDTHGLFSPDVFAKKNGLLIADMKAARSVAAAILDGQETGISCAYPHSEIPDELTECDSGNIGIRISANEADKPFGTTLNLIPRNIVVGIGCKRGTSCDRIITHITDVFAANGIDIRRMSAAATIDIKADEAGIREFCERFGIPMKTFTAKELMSLQGEVSHSDFVEETTGADNVCERAAVCAGGKIIVPKTAHKGITAAIAELPINIDFKKE